MTKTINGRKKNVMNNETKKEEEILYLYSNPINNNSDINADITPPTSVCEFVLGQKLGEGTFGTVRLGINRQTGEKVAIKILEKNRISNIDDRIRIEREIKLLDFGLSNTFEKGLLTTACGSPIYVLLKC